MNSDTLIIENSHLQGNWRRVSQGVVTFFFWCYIGVELTYHHQLDPLRKVLAKDLAAYFDVNLLELAHWQRSRELNIQLNDEGNIQQVKAIYLN